MKFKFLACGVAAPLLVSGSIFAATITTPLNDQTRIDAIRELLKDERFTEDFINSAVAKTLREEGIKPMVKDVLHPEELPKAHEGMEKEPEPDKTPPKQSGDNMIKSPTGGMAAPGPFDAVEQPTAVKAENFGKPKSELMQRKVIPAESSAEHVDFFISLSCPWCEKLWKNLRADPVGREHLLEDKLEIRVMPESDAEAAICMIYEYILSQNPEKALDFLDFYYGKGKSMAAMPQADLLKEIEDWLKENNVGSFEAFRRNEAALNGVASKIQGNIARAKELNVTGYPSVWPDGKEDKSYFTKVIDNTNKRNNK